MRSDSGACMIFDVKAVSQEGQHGQESFAHFVIVELRKYMNKPKKYSWDSALRPAPVWIVSRMRIPQCGPARNPPTPVCSALYSGPKWSTTATFIVNTDCKVTYSRWSFIVIFDIYWDTEYQVTDSKYWLETLNTK